MKHYPVMLKECIDELNIHEDGIYVDATLGAGGHSYEIAKRLKNGRLIVFDKDEEAIQRGRKRLKEFEDKVIYCHRSYAEMSQALAEEGIEAVDGILFDLGVSSPQFDDPKRGFSYRFDEKLDMRMDQRQAFSAYDVVNTYSEEALEEILRIYGEERYAKGIAHEIVKARPLQTTFDLVEAVKAAYPAAAMRRGHPARQTFQAIRIEVNDELKDLKKALKDAIKLIKPKGRIVVLSFHSLEDRLVKSFFNAYGKKEKVDPRIPIPIEKPLNYKVRKKGKKASKKELELNRRSRSALLRSIERVR